MKPHINIGNIGHIDHGKTTLTAAICSALGATLKQPEPVMVCPPSDDLRGLAIENTAMEYTPAPVIVDPPPHRRSPVMAMMALTALAMMPGMGGGPLAADIRNDPNREKTPEDLERMAAAQRKRDRKAARNGLPNAQGLP